MIISILEPLPTHIVTSPSTSFCLFCNSCFELIIFSNRTSIKYSGVTINTSKVHINNLYIKYTLVQFAILLIHQIFRVFPLPVTSPFAVEALSFRLRSKLGLLHLSSNLLAVLLKVPLLPFALFLNQWSLSTINTRCSFLISTFADFSIAKSLGITFVIPCILQFITKFQ